MWGNLQGWLISAVMFLAAVGMLVVIAMPEQESSPAGLVPLAYKPIALPVSADTVRPTGTNGCDAGDAYREAIELYLQNPSVYADAARVQVLRLPAVTKIKEAADCAGMRLFEKDPRKFINYDSKKAWIDALMALGQATNDVGLQFRDSDPKTAKEYYEAGFVLGRNLFQERATWDELNKGLSIMTMSSGALTKLSDMAGDSARVDVLQKFDDQVQAYHSDIQEKVAAPLGNPVESYSSKYAGDIFAVAKSPAVERCWRVTAILHMGHYRWNVADDRKGDQKWAPKELKLLENSSDPAIHIAAEVATNLTLDEQHMTGSGQ